MNLEADELRAALIVAAFEASGATVVDLSAVGGGCPDLLIGYQGRIALCETQVPGAVPSLERQAWYEAWRGGMAITVLHSSEVAHVLRTLLEIA